MSSFMTDRLIDRKLERINIRLHRREGDLSEAETKLTKMKIANEDITAIKERSTPIRNPA